MENKILLKDSLIDLAVEGDIVKKLVSAILLAKSKLVMAERIRNKLN